MRLWTTVGDKASLLYCTPPRIQDVMLRSAGNALRSGRKMNDRE